MVRPFKSGIGTMVVFLMELLVVLVQFNLLPFYTNATEEEERQARSTEVIIRLVPIFLIITIVFMGLGILWNVIDFYTVRRYGVHRYTIVHKYMERYNKWMNPVKARVATRQVFETPGMMAAPVTPVTPDFVDETKKPGEDDPNLESIMNQSAKTDATNKVRGDLRDSKWQVNKARKENKDDERFDDQVLFKDDEWKPGFPEFVSN